MSAVVGRPGRPATADVRPLWRQVAVPSEHGGWSLTAEPAVLGLVVAWSTSGAVLGLAALLAFVARTPLKLALVDRWRGRRLPRTTLAVRVAAIEVSVLVALGVLATITAVDLRFVIPLALAAPLVLVELWFDMRSKGRRLAPELAGTIGIGSTAAAIALAGGESASLAIGLWLVIAARGGAAIPYVRTQILRLHGRDAHRWQSDAAQALAVAAVAAGVVFGAVHLAAASAVFVVSGVNVMLVRRMPRPAVVIGVQQMVFGLLVVAVTAVATIAA